MCYNVYVDTNFNLMKMVNMMSTALTFDILSELPPEIDDDGTMWYRNEVGKLHRDNDQPALVFVDGSKVWFKNGKKHRDDGKPAMVLTGVTKWYKDGKLHRDNGKPTIIWADEGEEHV